MIKTILIITLMLIFTGCIFEANAATIYTVSGHIYNENNECIEGAEIKFIDIQGKWNDFDKNEELKGVALSKADGFYQTSFSFTEKTLFGSLTQYISEFSYSVSKIGYKTQIITVSIKNGDSKNKDVVLLKDK